MFEEELLTIVSTWPVEQVDNYIQKLEARLVVMEQLIKELKHLRKKKSRKKVLDTGTRGGL